MILSMPCNIMPYRDAAHVLNEITIKQEKKKKKFMTVVKREEFLKSFLLQL